MKNLKFSRLFAAMMVVACLALAGCKQPEDETPEDSVGRPLTADDAIIGTWTYTDKSWNAYGDYACRISTNKIETSSWGVHNSPVIIIEISDDSGYLYYQCDKNLPLYGGGEVPDSAGKWGAVAYKNLTEDSVLMCDIYKDPLTLASSLKEAVTLYTVENGYFDSLESTLFNRVK